MDVALGLLLAAGLVTLAFITTGGFDVTAGGGDTWSDIVIVLIGAAACGAVPVLGAKAPAWGGATVALFAAATALAALSIAWSVQPDYSWQAASQMLAYLAAFAGAAALARLAPHRWTILVGAIAAASVALAAWALIVKVFPGTLDAGDTLGRLQAPFGYWNSVGVMAAMGLAPCLWLGARRHPNLVLRTLAPAGIALLVSAVVLSFSRSAVLEALICLGCWFAFVPLRLRGAAVLAVGGAGAAVISGWALNTNALTGDGIPDAARNSAGHTFGIVLVVTLAVVCAAGLACAVALDRARPPAATRRRIGIALIVLVALVPVGGVGALAASSRGLTGQVSHVWNTLTNPAGGVGDQPGRLLQLGNSRPLYWSEGITVGEHALLGGVGAEGFATARTAYTTNTAPVSHVHSYVIQTFADFGMIGLALNLALLIAWAIAAARPLTPRTRWSALLADQAREREGLITLAVVVLGFGVQSAIDWTWFFAGVAIPALLCAGWLAGRGPLARPVGVAAERTPILQRAGAGAAVTGLVAVALLGAWLVWQPLRSADALSSALNAASAGNTPKAFTDAREASGIDPVSIQPLQILSSLYTGAGDGAQARQALVQATQRQPDNPQPWLWLGGLDLQFKHPGLALQALQRARHLARGDGLTVSLIVDAETDLAKHKR